MKANIRHCPKCASVRVHRSHRRGLAEWLLACLGGEILRCHDCRSRRYWIGAGSIRLAETHTPGRETGIVVLGTGFAICLAVVWWMMTHFNA
jgi:hypothetical protein